MDMIIEELVSKNFSVNVYLKFARILLTSIQSVASVSRDRFVSHDYYLYGKIDIPTNLSEKSLTHLFGLSKLVF